MYELSKCSDDNQAIHSHFKLSSLIFFVFIWLYVNKFDAEMFANFPRGSSWIVPSCEVEKTN